jgi:tripartite ATP-independent transporter DctM subunit
MNADLLQLLVPLGLLALLMASQVPVAFSLAVSGTVGIFLLQGFDIASSSLAAIPYSTTAVYTLTLVPMFILMGLFVSHSGMLADIFDVAQRLTRRVPGGLGISTVLACTLFAGVSGSSVADAATLGRLSIGEMSKRGYDKAYAAAIVAAAGTVAIVIPPSIALVVYGIITAESVGRLLLAGIVPGVLTAAAYIGTIVFFASRGKGRGGLATGTSSDSDATGTEAASAGERRAALFGMLAPIVLFLVVIGGIYAGVFTATEAGAAGAFSALIMSVIYMVVRRRGNPMETIRRAFGDALKEAASLTAMVFALIVGASIFTQYLVIAGVPTAVSKWILDLPVPPHMVVAIFLLAMVPLGMFVDGLSMLLIVTPLAYPIVTQLGFDGIWFGILLITMIEVGLLTPPVGLNVYVVSGLFEELRVEHVFRQVVPFLAAEAVALALIFVFPELVTFLPDLARGGT